MNMRRVAHCVVIVPQRPFRADVAAMRARWLCPLVILSLGADLTEEVLFRMSTFVQTSYEDFRDSRVFLECALDATITDKVSLEWSSGLRWDSQPHSDLGTWDLGNTVGLRFGLNQEE